MPLEFEPMLTPVPKILFTDIDGTLLNAEKELSAATIYELKRIKDRIPIILISSRMPAAMIHLQEVLEITHQPLICYNGGLIMHKGNVISSKTIANTITKDLIRFNDTINCHLSLYHIDEWYAPGMDYWTEREIKNTKVQPIIKDPLHVINDWEREDKAAHKIMCMGEKKGIDQLYAFLNDTYSEQVHFYRSKDTYIEIANKSISKKTAVQAISKKNGIPLKEVLAFGDNYNDQTMLEAVGIGVAVANAKPEVLAIADYKTLSGIEDGVAIFIRNNL